jgi:hypothetical protein
MSFMEGDGSGYVDIRYTIAIGHTERLFAFNVSCDLLQPSASSGLFSGIDERNAPGLSD